MSYAWTNFNSWSCYTMVSSTGSLTQCTYLRLIISSENVNQIKMLVISRYGFGYMGFWLCICWNDSSRTIISWWMWNWSIITYLSVNISFILSILSLSFVVYWVHQQFLNGLKLLNVFIIKLVYQNFLSMMFNSLVYQCLMNVDNFLK
jgi:hypothetical protein